jgi:hypothetical protein
MMNDAQRDIHQEVEILALGLTFHTLLLQKQKDTGNRCHVLIDRTPGI